jgi:homoserine dehydrogenase
MKTLSIGLFGFGCVGQGLYDVLNHSLHTIGKIKKICVKHRDKPRSIPTEFFTFERSQILDDPEIDTVVELIDDAQEAYKIVLQAIRNKKNVVTANKKMLAQNLLELQQEAVRNKVSLLYEASACASIPIIRLLEEYYDNEPLLYIGGIFNGTTNYILTRTVEAGLSYEEALKEAKEKGFAESNPEEDLEAWDPTYKCVILAFHALGIYLHPHRVPRLGITTLLQKDIAKAAAAKMKIRLVSYAGLSENGKYTAMVLPTWVDSSSPLYDTQYEYNGVITEGGFTSRQFLKGKGAGGHPTGSAVLSDLSALKYEYRYEYKKLIRESAIEADVDKLFRVYVRTSLETTLLRRYIFRWEEITQDKEHMSGIGWISFAALCELVPLLRQENGFLAMVGEPWNQLACNQSDIFDIHRAAGNGICQELERQ